MLHNPEYLYGILVVAAKIYLDFAWLLRMRLKILIKISKTAAA